MSCRIETMNSEGVVYGGWFVGNWFGEVVLVIYQVGEKQAKALVGPFALFKLQLF